jgi:uncharacterized Zn finger protein (UPF0148 family)
LRGCGGPLLRSDGTADCDACGLPLFPYAIERGSVLLECANHHHATTPVPRDDTVRRAVESWIARRGAQLHEQHERWGTDDEESD